MEHGVWTRCESTEVDGLEELAQQLFFFSGLEWCGATSDEILQKLTSPVLFSEEEIAQGYPKLLLTSLTFGLGIKNLMEGRVSTEEIMDGYRSFIFNLRKDPLGGGSVAFILKDQILQALMPLGLNTKANNRLL